MIIGQTVFTEVDNQEMKVKRTKLQFKFLLFNYLIVYSIDCLYSYYPFIQISLNFF